LVVNENNIKMNVKHTNIDQVMAASYARAEGLYNAQFLTFINVANSKKANFNTGCFK